MVAADDDGSTPTAAHLRYGVKLASGAMAGIVGATAVFPIDLIKTRLQMSPAVQQQSPIAITLSIIKQRGIKGMYSGLSANLIGITPEKAIKLVANDGLRELMGGTFGCPPDKLPITLGALAGGGAGLAQFIVTCPMEAVKIRMQMGLPKSVWGIVKELGTAGMYKGGCATLLRDIPFSMLLFQCNALLRERLCRGNNDGIVQVLKAGLGAGAIAAFAATPLDMIKTRIQGGRADSIHQAARQIYSEAGPAGFFRGGIQRVAIVAPLFGISLAVYEAQQRLLL